MKLTLAEPRYFKDSISTISDLVSEARFQISGEGMTLVAMDPANVAMVVFKLFSSSFVEYELENEVNLSLSLSHLKSVLRRVGSGDLMTLSTDASASKLQITLKGKTKRSFSLPLLETDDREQRIPNLQFAMNAQLPTETFTAAVEDMSIVSDSLSLQCDGKTVEVQASGDLTDAHVSIPDGDGVTLSFDGDAPVKSRYSIEYLKKIISAGKIADIVTVQFGQDYPLRLEFLEKDRVQLSFVLAPRVEND